MWAGDPSMPTIGTRAVATSNLQTTLASSLGPLLSLFPLKSLYTCPLTFSPAENPPPASHGPHNEIGTPYQGP